MPVTICEGGIENLLRVRSSRGTAADLRRQAWYEWGSDHEDRSFHQTAPLQFPKGACREITGKIARQCALEALVGAGCTDAQVLQ